MWICHKCESNNASLNKYCAFCWGRHKTRIEQTEEDLEYDSFMEDKFKVFCYLCDRFLSPVLVLGIERFIKSGSFIFSSETRKEMSHMTPQEELFARIYSGTKIKAVDMSVLERRAWMEELEKILTEARATYTALDEIEKTESRSRRSRIQSIGDGSAPNTNYDPTTSSALNTIRKRQKGTPGSAKDRTRKLMESMRGPDGSRLYSDSEIDAILSNKGMFSGKESSIPTSATTPVSTPNPPNEQANNELASNDSSEKKLSFSERIKLASQKAG